MPALNTTSHRLSVSVCVCLWLLAAASCTASDADRKALHDGFSQYTSRQFDQAQSAADQYLKKNPADPNIDEAYYLRGLALMAKGDKTAATQDFQAALAKSNRNDLIAKANRALGDIAYDGANWQQALDLYQKSLALLPPGNPTPADAHLNYRIGASLQSLGQWSKAAPYFQRVITLNTDPTLTQSSITRMDAKNFSLQFGAFHEQLKAAELVKQLKPANIPATITTELRESQLLYLVRSGNYPTWQEADTARSRLLTKYPLLTVVP